MTTRLLLLYMLVVVSFFLNASPAADAEENPRETAGSQEIPDSPAANQILRQVIPPAPVNLTLAEEISLLEKTLGITITLDSNIDSDQKISARPKGLAPDDALRYLLSGYDYYLLYGSDTERGPNRLKGVWVYPRGSGTGSRSVPSHKNQQTSPPSTPTAICNLLSLKKALSISSSEGLRVFTDCIRNNDEAAWNETIDKSLALGIPITQQQLEDIYLKAASEQVRLNIIHSMRKYLELDTPGLQRLIDMAQQDPSPIIRNESKELEKSLEDTASSP